MVRETAILPWQASRLAWMHRLIDMLGHAPTGPALDGSPFRPVGFSPLGRGRGAGRCAAREVAESGNSVVFTRGRCRPALTAARTHRARRFIVGAVHDAVEPTSPHGAENLTSSNRSHRIADRQAYPLGLRRTIFVTAGASGHTALDPRLRCRLLLSDAVVQPHLCPVQWLRGHVSGGEFEKSEQR